LKKDDIEVGETYLFVGSDSLKRAHLAGHPFTVTSIDKVYRKISYRKGKRSMKVTRFFNDDGVGARAEELETLPATGFHQCTTCNEWSRLEDLHAAEENETIVKACPHCGATVTLQPPPADPWNGDDVRELPCTQCETGEFKFYSGGGPSGISTYQCTDCGHTVTFP
jgi:hypothetical protein